MQLIYRGVSYEPVNPEGKFAKNEPSGIDRGAPPNNKDCKVVLTQPTFVLLTYRGVRYLRRG